MENKKIRRAFSSVDLPSSTSLHSRPSLHCNEDITSSSSLHSIDTNVHRKESTVTKNDLSTLDLHSTNSNYLYLQMSNSSTDPNILKTISSNSPVSTLSDSS